MRYNFTKKKGAKMNRKSCKGCIYHKGGNDTKSGGGIKFCHYMLITGKSRGCPADKCDKKVVDEPYPFSNRKTLSAKRKNR